MIFFALSWINNVEDSKIEDPTERIRISCNFKHVEHKKIEVLQILPNGDWSEVIQDSVPDCRQILGHIDSHTVVACDCDHEKNS